MRYTHQGVLLAIFCLGACSTQPVIDSEAECVARGGQWAGIDAKSAPVCTVTWKRCTDASQCEGTCVAPFGAHEGDKVIGACSNPRQVAGIFSSLVVVNGLARTADIVE